MTPAAHVDSMSGLVHEWRPGTEGAPTLLLIHGLGDSRQTWAEAFAAPSLAGYGLCAVDLPGFGASAPLRPFTFRSCVERLAVLSDAKLPAPLVAVGHSMGGAVATLLAEQRCDVHGLVLVEANLTTAPPGSIAETAVRARAAGRFADWFAEFRRAIASEIADASMRRYLGSLDRADVETFAEAAQELFDYSQEDGNGRRYLALDVPRLYVAGRGVMSVTHEFLARNGLEVQHYPDAGHAVMVDEPSFYETLDRWIRDNVTAGRQESRAT